MQYLFLCLILDALSGWWPDRVLWWLGYLGLLENTIIRPPRSEAVFHIQRTADAELAAVVQGAVFADQILFVRAKSRGLRGDWEL